MPFVKARTVLKLTAMVEIARTFEALSVGKARKVGAVVFSPDMREIFGVGYNGPGAGLDHDLSGIDPGVSSGDAHAEVNALMSVPRGLPRRSLILVVTCQPCSTCAAYVMNCPAIGGVIYDVQDGAKHEGLLRIKAVGIPAAPVHDVEASELRCREGVDRAPVSEALENLLNQTTDNWNGGCPAASMMGGPNA